MSSGAFLYHHRPLDQVYGKQFGIIRSNDEFGNKVFNLSSISLISYDVVSVKGIFDRSNETLARYIGEARVFLIIDATVFALHKDPIIGYFSCKGIPTARFVCEASEHNKKMELVTEFCSFCLREGISRRDIIICIGGGIIGDVGSLAANLIKRSTPCIRIPTTLLAVIDASIGVKTGINFCGMKNALGTYFPPFKVVYDLSLLSTLPRNIISNGLAEIIKIVAIKSRLAWEKLEKSAYGFFTFPYGEEQVDLIESAIVFMLEELQPNLYELNLKRIVDYGHEFGHCVEVASDYELQHGEAIGIGMLIANCIAFRQEILGSDDFIRFVRLMKKAGLPLFHRCVDVNFLRTSLETIRKHKNGDINLVSLEEIGRPCFMNVVGQDDLAFAVDCLRGLSDERMVI